MPPCTTYLTSWRVRLFDFWAMARLIVVDGQDLLTVLCVYLPLSHHVVPTLAEFWSIGIFLSPALIILKPSHIIVE